MPNLQELLKNAQVEWKTLGEVCNISAGRDVPKHSFLKERNNEHCVPIISNGTAENAIYGYTATAQITMPAVTISARGTIGYIKYRDYPYYPIVRLLSLIPKQDSQLSAKYLYYCLSKKEFLTPTSAIRQLTIPMVKEEKIPIPSLEVQAEIVRILDTFAELTAELTVELTAELTLRKKQYRYYLEKLLSEEYLRECSEKVGGLVFYELQEIFDTRNGYTPSKTKKEYWEDGTIPWFRMEDIRTSGHVLYSSIQHVTASAIKGKLFKEDSIVLATSATIGEHALIKVPFLANQRFTCFSLKEEFRESANIKYVYYYFYLIDEWCKKNVNVGNFASVDVDGLMHQVIPLPPLSVQSHIVGILEKFEHMVQEVSGLLPQEIALRKKQYEYYRDKLLSFNLSWPRMRQ